MSRNIKSNLKNPQNKLFLKTTYNPRSNNRNECNLSPYHIKNNSNMTTDYLSFYTNESTNKSNKKIGCGKINYFYKNYRMNSINKNKERYIQTQTQSKQMSRNNSKKNDLLCMKSNLKKSFSLSKTNCNSLMISKQLKKQEKKSNKIYKLLLKEVEKSNKNKKSNKKIKNSNKFKKNKSTNHMHIHHENKFLNSINTINIKTKTNNSNIMKSEYNTKNFNYNKNIEEKIFNHTSKNKSKNKNNNLSLTLNYNDKKNNPHKINNKIIYTNILNKNKQKNIKKKINIATFHKTCINTPIETFRKKEQIISLTKEIETKQNEIINLQSIVKEKDIYIKNLEEKISSLNITQTIDKEYEKYSKIIIVKNIKNLTSENEQLHKQVLEYKNKETKLLKLLQNMKKSGIDIDNILNQVNTDENNNINLNSNLNSKNSNLTELNSNSNNNSNNKYDDVILKTDTTNNTNITNNTFLPFNLNEEQKNISHKSCINLERNLPELPLKNINEYFNENYFSNQNDNTNANGNIQIQITNNLDCNILQDN